MNSSSLEVKRRQRRAKTDRLDVHKWLMMLLRCLAGEKRVWRVVRVPSVESESEAGGALAGLTMNRPATETSCPRALPSWRSASG